MRIAFIANSRDPISQRMLANFDIVLALDPGSGEPHVVTNLPRGLEDVTVTTLGKLPDDVMDAVNAQNAAARYYLPVKTLVDALADAWWVKAGAAYAELAEMVADED